MNNYLKRAGGDIAAGANGFTHAEPGSPYKAMREKTIDQHHRLPA